MSVYAGPADWWTDGTDAGRTHIATKGVVQSGLVLNLDAGASSSYPGTGTTWNDLSGNGLVSTLVNSPSYSDSKFSLNGTNQYFTVPDNNIFNFAAGDFTIEIAVKFNELTSGRSLWGQTNAVLGSYAPILIFKYVNIISFWASSSGSTWDILNNSIQIGTSYLSTTSWSVIGLTRSSTTWKSYFNGQEINSATASGTLYNSTDVLQIGARTSASEYLSGDISFNRVYNRALSTAEIQQNFYALRGRFGI